MNKRQAKKFVKEKYGPNADVVSVSAKNRHERFGIAYTEPKTMHSPAILFILGHGDSYDSAIKHAEASPNAIEAAKRWESLKLDFKEFGEDPEAFIRKMNLEAEEKKNQLLKEIQDGRTSQAEPSQGPEVSSDQGSRG